MALDLPVDVERLRAEVAATESRLKDLNALLAISERLYGAPDGPNGSRDEIDRSPQSDGAGSEPAGVLADKSTSESALYVFRRHPGEIVDLADVVSEMTDLGWDNGSEAPVDTVRVAVSRLMKKAGSGIERVRLGYYRYTPPSESPATPDITHLAIPALTSERAYVVKEGDA